VYDNKTQHYDHISAFIKSVRASDIDSALYWLAKMLYAGEDSRFIARRLIILAAEDIGISDPFALVVANEAYRATEIIGMPEARIILAEAVIYLCQAPKSNAVLKAIDRAYADVENNPTEDVPLHLRDSHYKSAARLGYGKGYKYPHDYKGKINQDYRQRKTKYFTQE